MPAAPAPEADRPAAADDAAPAGLRERKKRATRHALRLAALRLVAERGVDAVTTDEIAAAADVSVRTFFNYFASKEDALVGNDPTLGETLVAELVERPADEPPLESLRAVLTSYARSAPLDGEVWRLRMRVVEANPHLLPALHGASAQLERRITAAVAERLDVDPVTDPYPRLVVAVAIAAVRAATQHSGATGFARPLDTIVGEYFDALAAGLPAPAPRSGGGPARTGAGRVPGPGRA
ncbi:TetR/AcrR family transcriptional regulator [Cellulomonas carbonis]|uniref:TetR family transcriptional regulator n=1 Tax=Cellulomonas carbonis T26 TaxID=947969 RepID=A0A0A0BQB1_9CELL|nr:TetR/AcrR family transcriptional regulator [Cellulomonas carbonis]KGM09842.1 TetR family transcriptional regulator [Cellulomonas carbonis T26]GGC13404.1 hypothetical protein GCM10010972_28370 [Cellulomonas carbonis]